MAMASTATLSAHRLHSGSSCSLISSVGGVGGVGGDGCLNGYGIQVKTVSRQCRRRQQIGRPSSAGGRSPVAIDKSGCVGTLGVSSAGSGAAIPTSCRRGDQHQRLAAAASETWRSISRDASGRLGFCQLIAGPGSRPACACGRRRWQQRATRGVAVVAFAAVHDSSSVTARASSPPPPKMAPQGSEAVEDNPGLCENPDQTTQDYIMQQTMYRIKDPKASLDFYSRVLGMRLLKRFDFPDMKFSLYFLGYAEPADIPKTSTERTVWTFRQKGTLELTHNWGTEADENFSGYHNGNSDPRGFGHIGITVPDVDKTCERFEKLGVEFVKRPNDGKMKGLAFIKDPDGYWIEILSAENMGAM